MAGRGAFCPAKIESDVQMCVVLEVEMFMFSGTSLENSLYSLSVLSEFKMEFNNQ